MTSTTTAASGCAASSLLAPLFDGPPLRLAEAARTRVSVHYETGVAGLPVLCVCTPEAVLLPNAVVLSTLPDRGAVAVGAGTMDSDDTTWRVTRWWSPPRPSGLAPPSHPGPVLEWFRAVRVSGGPAVRPTYHGLVPAELVGAGPGLTPSGDDVLAGALVAAHATADPRLPHWRRATRLALVHRATTVVSRGLLQHALDGYATPELADAVVALCRGEDPAVALDRLRGVGHTSGSALLAGALYSLTTRTLRGAA